MSLVLRLRWGGGSDKQYALVRRGLPIGNLTSQVFANIYLNELDQFVKHKIKAKYYFRYTDDFVIIHQDETHLVKLTRGLQDFLRRELCLELHPDKVSIRKLRQGVDFLGYVILPHHTALRTKTKKRMFKKLFQKQYLLQQRLLDETDFEQAMQSYLGLLSHCNAYDLSMAVKNNFCRNRAKS